MHHFNIYFQINKSFSYFFSLGNAAVSKINFGKVELEGRGDTSLHVLGPDGDVLVKNDSLGLATFYLDGKRFRERSKLGESLALKLWNRVHLPFSVVKTKLDIVQLDIQHTGTSLNVEFSSEIDSGSKTNVILGASDQGRRVTVNVFLAGLKEGSANISLNKSGAAEHKAYNVEK